MLASVTRAMSGLVLAPATDRASTSAHACLPGHCVSYTTSALKTQCTNQAIEDTHFCAEHHELTRASYAAYKKLEAAWAKAAGSKCPDEPRAANVYWRTLLSLSTRAADARQAFRERWVVPPCWDFGHQQRIDLLREYAEMYEAQLEWLEQRLASERTEQLELERRDRLQAVRARERELAETRQRLDQRNAELLRQRAEEKATRAAEKAARAAARADQKELDRQMQTTSDELLERRLRHEKNSQGEGSELKVTPEQRLLLHQFLMTVCQSMMSSKARVNGTGYRSAGSTLGMEVCAFWLLVMAQIVNPAWTAWFPHIRHAYRVTYDRFPPSGSGVVLFLPRAVVERLDYNTALLISAERYDTDPQLPDKLVPVYWVEELLVLIFNVMLDEERQLGFERVAELLSTKGKKLLRPNVMKQRSNELERLLWDR